MTPPLCPLCHRRASEKCGWTGTIMADGRPYTYCTTPCTSPFHAAGDWGPALLEFVSLAVSRSDMPTDLYAKALALYAAVEGREEGK
jgi:hypothetical protein